MVVGVGGGGWLLGGYCTRGYYVQLEYNEGKDTICVVLLWLVFLPYLLCIEFGLIVLFHFV